MKIVAWNMRAGGTERHWLRVFAAFQPDVVLAQECLPPPLDFERAGSLAFWSPAKVYPRPREIGPAARAPAPAKRMRWGSCVYCSAGAVRPLAVPQFDGWVKAADLERPDGTVLRLVSVHVPGRENGDYVGAANDIVDRLQDLGRPDAWVIGGDFNITAARRRPGEKRENSRGELAFYERLERELGLVSAWDVAGSGAPLPQTLRWTGNPAEAYHCDGFFVPTGWPVDVEVAAGPDWDRLSDHNPVVLRLGTARLRPGEAGQPS